MLSPRCPIWYNAARLWGLVASLAVIVAGASALLAQPGADESVVPIQRIFLEPERAAKELEKAPQGTLLALPRQEFEDRLQRVRSVVQARSQKPRLTRTHYSAELVDRAFANGSGQWTLAHPGDAAAILPIDSLNLALAKARWNDGSDAILAEFDGKSLGLLVKPAANPTCVFDWSARGTPINDGIAFHLAVPFCPLTTFEFKLPADHWLSVPKGTAVVTGPHDTESPAKRLWKIQITGAKPIDITVRKLTQPNGPAPTIFSRVESTQLLAHDRIAVEHDFQIDILNGSARELILEGSGSLEPYQVMLLGGDVASWQWKEVAGKKDAKGKLTPASGVLTIQFAQPMQSKIKSLQVKSVCPPVGAGPWTSPTLRVRNAISRGETLRLRLPSDVALGRCDLGTFRPTSVATETDGTQILNLAETAEDIQASRRPTMDLPAKSVDLFTNESFQWRIDARGASLDAEIQYALTRGELSELRLKAPMSPYRIETLEMQPAELLRGWRNDGNDVVVELKQRLTSAKKVTLNVQLRASTRDLTAGPRLLTYPEFGPLDSSRRQGDVSIFVDSVFQPQLVNSSISPSSLDDSLIGKNGVRPSYRFALRDQRLNAVLRVVPQPVQTQFVGRHSLTLSDQQALLRSHWEAQPMVGEPEFLDFRCPPGSASWKLGEEPGSLKIHHWERLPWQETLPHFLTFGAPTGLNAAAVESIVPKDRLWRFHLAERLRARAGFTLETVLPPGRIDNDGRQAGTGVRVWSAPLLTPAQRTNVAEEVTIVSSDEPITRVTSEGAFETSVPLKADKALTSLALHQSDAPRSMRAPSITLWTNPARRTTSPLELCDEARHSIYVHRDGRVYHRIQFRLWHGQNRTCDLKLAADWQVLSVKVHDRWLDHLEVASSPSEVCVSMPVDQNGEFVRYEILASLNAAPSVPAMPGLQEIRMPRIGWPVAPLEVHTRLFLEDGLTPLESPALARVGVPRRIADRTESLRWLRQAWNAGQAWLPLGAPPDVTARIESQRNSVLTAEAKFRTVSGKSMKLGQALDRLVLDHLKDASPLVLDRMALRSLGLSADTVVAPDWLNEKSGRPFWEKLNLIYVSCPRGALLTSAQRLQDMGINPNDPSETAELDDAIQEAILHGRDASAGFYLVPAWLQWAANDRLAMATDSAANHSKPTDDMTEWEIRPEHPRPGSIVVVEATNARIIGVLMAFVAALILWKVQRALQPVAGFRVCILVMTVIGSIVVWSAPAVRELFLWPTCSVAILGSLAGVVRLVRQRGQRSATGLSTINHPAATVAMVGLAVLGATLIGNAQTPTPRSYPVFVIGGAQPKVLVTPELIAKLDELEKQPALGSAGAVLVRAKYIGKVKEAQAKFDVVYEIHSLKDKTNLVIPLSGVQLGEGAFLDGAPVFLAPNKSGYTLPIRGTGPHHLRLSFSAAIRTAPKTDQLDLQFMAPKLAQNEITLQWHDPVQTVQCLRGWGEEKMFTDPRQAVKEWQSQLGYENEVQLRWSNAVSPAAPKTIDVKESHFWDLRPGSLSLFSTFQYVIGEGSLAQLIVAIPDGLQVRSVEALATPTSAPALPIVVKQWTVTGKGTNRRLNVAFLQPATGNVTLNLEIAPQAFGKKNKLLLTLPTPQQGKSTGVLGYRTDAAEVRSIAQNLVAVQSIQVEAFEKQWKAQNGPLVPPASRAKSFQRTNHQPAALELWIEPSTRQATLQFNWKIEPQFADVHGKVTITSPLQDLLLIEFFADNSLTLAKVVGPDVQRWHLQDSLLQVWLKQPRKETTLEITGWRKSTPGPKSFVVPAIYPLDAQLGAATLAVQPAPGIRLKPEQLRNVHADPIERNRFLIDKLPYFASFLLSSEPMVPEATMLTKVHASDSKIEGAISIRVVTRRGQLPVLKIHLKDWDDQPWQLDAPGATVQRSDGKGSKHAIWTLKYPVGQPQEAFITLHGRVARDLPIVEIDGAVLQGHWLAWRDVEMRSANQAKPIANQRGIQEKLLGFQADPWFKLAPLWNGSAAPKSLRAALLKATERTSSRVLASSEEAWLGEGSEWLREASFWVESRERAEWRFKFPAPIDAVNAWADGHVQAILPSAARECAVSLDASSSPRHIKLRWKYAKLAESPIAPNIAAIQVEQAALPNHERLVWIPAGFRHASFVPTFVARLVHDAQEHMEIAAVLAQQSAQFTDAATRIAGRQQSFFACIRHAEYALLLAKNADAAFDPAPLRQRLGDLKDRNAALAKERQYDDQRKVAERSRKISPSSGNLEREAIPFLLPPNLPSLNLQSTADEQSAQQRMTNELVLLAATFLFVFSYFRRGWSLLSLAAPEITIGLVILAMAQFGIGFVGIALVTSIAVARISWIAAALRSHAAQEPNGDPGPLTNDQAPPVL